MGTDVTAKQRLDVLLVERGLCDSRSRAQARILAGDVVVGDHRVDKAGTPYILEINPNCGVYYAPSDPGSADLALLNDPAGHQGFTDLLIRAGLARHARRQQGWETLPTSQNGYAVFANRAIPEGETIMPFEGTSHTLVTRDWVEQFQTLPMIPKLR